MKQGYCRYISPSIADEGGRARSQSHLSTVQGTEIRQSGSFPSPTPTGSGFVRNETSQAPCKKTASGPLRPRLESNLEFRGRGGVSTRWHLFDYFKSPSSILVCAVCPAAPLFERVPSVVNGALNNPSTPTVVLSMTCGVVDRSREHSTHVCRRSKDPRGSGLGRGSALKVQE